MSGRCVLATGPQPVSYSLSSVFLPGLISFYSLLVHVISIYTPSPFKAILLTPYYFPYSSTSLLTS